MKALATALVKARSEIHAIAKNSTNPFFKSKYANLDTIIETVMPILNGHGLTILQGCVLPVTDEHMRVTAFSVRTTLLHESGESLDRDVVVPLAWQAVKGPNGTVTHVPQSDPQGAGSAMTYGKRYGIAGLLCLATDEDDDGNSASRGAAKASTQRTAARPNAAPPKPAGANGTTASGPLMPVGKSKGKPLASLDELTLLGAAKWMRENNPTRYAADLTNIDDVLESRRLASENEKVTA